MTASRARSRRLAGAAASFATAVATALIGAPAAASPLPEMVGATGGSGGWNARVTGAGPASTYFNPALLPDAREQLELGFFVIESELRIDVQGRPAGADVAAAIDDSRGPDGPLEVRPLPTAQLQAQSPRQGEGAGDATNGYIAIGMVKRLFGPRLVLGFQALLPAGQIQQQRAFYSDQREQYFSNSLHFELLGDRLTLTTFSFALGSRVMDQLSLGVGFSASIATAVTSPVFVPNAADYSAIYLDSDIAVSTKLTPHFGVTFRPRENVTLAATLHTPSRVEVSGKNEIRVANEITAEQVFTFVHGDEPLGVAAAAAWNICDAGGLGYTVAGTLLWRDWSSYRDRHGEAPLDAWKDTFTGTLGARYAASGFTVHLDGSYVPSPVPEQDGRTNYVDNARAGLAAGIGGELTLFGTRVRGSFNLHGQRLLARSVSKRSAAAHPVVDEFPDGSVNPSVDPDAPLPEAVGLQSNNPGFPGYASEGWLFGAGITLETRF